jgi:hypothetical protein
MQRYAPLGDWRAHDDRLRPRPPKAATHVASFPIQEDHGEQFGGSLIANLQRESLLSR